MKELQLLVKQDIGAVSTNFEEIKVQLQAKMKEYEEVVVDDSNRVERKKDVAFLRSYLKDIKEKEKEVKEACLVPYNTFKEKANELVEIINKPIALIDNQVKELEERTRIEKKMEIQQIFDELVGELEEYVSLENIYDKKWENVATSMKSIREGMSNNLATIKQGLFVLQSSMSEKKEEALNMFLDDFDLAKAMNILNRYEQQKVETLKRQQEENERQKQREIELERERIRREERERLMREQQEQEEIRRKHELELEQAREEERRLALIAAEEAKERDLVAMMAQKQEEGAEVNLYSYIINATKSEIEQLELYMESIGLEYERTVEE